MEGKQAQPSTPKAVQDCRDLLLWMLPQLDKLPRNRRYTLGEKLENRLLIILESLVTAAYAPNKRTFLFQANRDLEVCRHLWRLCYDIHAIPSGSYQHGGKLIPLPAKLSHVKVFHRLHSPLPSPMLVDNN